MTKAQIVSFLRCPAAGVVDYAIEQANLTQKELMAVTMCCRQGMTQEAAAEAADVSVESIKKWAEAGIKKLGAAWEGSWWIQKVIS